MTVALPHPEYRYVDLAVGPPANRNRIVDVAEIDNLVPAHGEAYATYFRFRDDLKKHVDETGSVSGYRGPCYADFLPIDIDADDLEDARDRLARLVGSLEVLFEVPYAHLLVFFSGAKGFHVCLPTGLFGDVAPGFRLPEIWRAIAKELAGDVQIDLAVYDRTRLFRIPTTKHPKTGLYKVALPKEALGWSPSQIRTYAADWRREPPLPDVEPAEALVELYEKHKIERPRPTATAMRPADPPRLDPSALPPRTKLCYRHLLLGVDEGGRDNAALRLAVYLRREGYDAAYAEAVLVEWNRRNRPPLGESALHDKIARVFGSGADTGATYDFGCYDPVLDSVCDRRCYLHPAKRRNDRGAEVAAHGPAPLPALDYREAGILYREYVANLATRRVRLGLGTIDEAMRGIAPGEVCTVLARTSVGKTTILQNVLHHIDEAGAPAAFFSLEMPAVSVYERGAQMVLGLSGTDVEALFADIAKADRAIDEVFRAHPRVYIVPKGRLSIADVAEIARRIETERLGGARLACLGIDYLGLLDAGRSKDQYEAVSALARGAKDLAKEADVAVVVLHQTSRQGSQNDAVSLEMARDSGVVEEASDFILGAWRPNFEQDGADDYLVVKLLKNRKGRLPEAYFDFDRTTLRITERTGRVVGPSTRSRLEVYG